MLNLDGTRTDCAPGPLILSPLQVRPSETTVWELQEAPLYIVWSSSVGDKTSMFLTDSAGLPIPGKVLSLKESSSSINVFTPLNPLMPNHRYHIYLETEDSSSIRLRWYQPMLIKENAIG